MRIAVLVIERPGTQTIHVIVIVPKQPFYGLWIACTVALTMDRPIPIPFTAPECDSSTGLSPRVVLTRPYPLLVTLLTLELWL